MTLKIDFGSEKDFKKTTNKNTVETRLLKQEREIQA